MQVPGSGERIVEPGYDAQHRDRVNEHLDQSASVIIRISRAQDHEEHQDNFRGGGQLAIDAWREWPVTRNQKNHYVNYEDQHLAASNQDGKPTSKVHLERA